MENDLKEHKQVSVQLGKTLNKKYGFKQILGPIILGLKDVVQKFRTKRIKVHKNSKFRKKYG